MTTRPDTAPDTAPADEPANPHSSVPADPRTPGHEHGEGPRDRRHRLAQAMADAHDAGRSWAQVGALFGYSERHAAGWPVR